MLPGHFRGCLCPAVFAVRSDLRSIFFASDLSASDLPRCLRSVYFLTFRPHLAAIPFGFFPTPLEHLSLIRFISPWVLRRRHGGGTGRSPSAWRTARQWRPARRRRWASAPPPPPLGALLPLPRKLRHFPDAAVLLASLHSDLPCPPPPFLIRLLHALLPVFLPDRPFSACFRVRQRASRRSPFRILLSRAHPTSLCAFAGITIYDNEASFTGQPSGTDGVLIGVTGLEQLESRVAVTTDMWRANHQKKGYMAVTAHFIDEKWTLKSFLLRFVYVPHPHTAELIADVLHDVLCDWHLERKISTVTLDNCTVNDNLMEKIEDKLPLDSLMLKDDDGKKLLHMRCAAHVLNLIVKDGLAAMDKDDGLERIRESVRFWSATPKRLEKFEKKASELNIKFERRLVLDCKTRWNSTYIMLSTAVEYKSVFARLSLREKLFAPLCPTEADWKVAKDICDRLKMFFDITELLSGTKYVTANLFFPRICGIYLAIRKWTKSNDPQVEKMAASMKDKFNKYWSDVHGLMAVATVLDPRFKLHMLQALFTNIYGAEGADVKIREIRSLMYNLVKEYQQSPEDVCTSAVSSTSIQNSGIGEDEVFNIFDQHMSSQPANSSSHVRTELDLYLEEPTVNRTQDLDIVNWWKYGGIKYPTLQRIASDLMAIPVTSVASESVFSTGGRIISPHRSRLAPKVVEALMSMQAWSRAEMLGDDNPAIAAMMTCLNDEEESLGDLESAVVDC